MDSIKQAKHIDDEVPRILRDFVVGNNINAILVLYNYNVAEANDCAAELFGYKSRTELIRVHSDHLLTPESAYIARERINRRINGHPPLHSQLYDCIRKDGSVFYAEVSMIPWPSIPSIGIALIRDVTQREESIAEITKSEQLYRSITKKLPTGIALINSNGEVVYTNSEAEKISLYRQLPEGKWENAIHPDDSVTRELFRDALINNTSKHNHEAHLLRSDGSSCWVSASWEPLYREDGAFIAIQIAFSDITEKKLAVDALQQAEERYRLLAENSSDIHYEMGRDGKFVYISQSIRRFGYTQEEWIGKSLLEFLPPEEHHAFIKRLSQDISEMPTRRYEVQMLRKDGSTVWMEVSIDTVKEKGRPIRSQGIAREITERILAQIALQRSESRFRSLVANIPGAVFRCYFDENWTMDYISDTIESLTGYPASDFINNSKRTYFSIIHADDRKLVHNRINTAAIERKPYEIEYRVRNKCHGYRWVYEKGQAEFDSDGSVLYLNGAIFDIDNRKRSEQWIVTQRDLAMKLAATSDLYTALSDLLQTAINISEMDSGGIGLFNETTGDLELICCVGISPEFVKEVTCIPPDSYIAKLVMKCEPMYDLLEGEHGKEPYVIAEGFRTIASLPVKFKNDVIGYMNIASHSVESIPRSSRVALETIATQLGHVIRRIKTEEDLRKAHENLEKAYELQKEFLNNVTHEVRTPLTAVQGYVDVLMEGLIGGVSEEQMRLLKKVRSNSDRLLEIVDGVLEITKLKTGSQALRAKACNPYKIIDKAVSMVQLQAEQKGLKLVIENSDRNNLGVYDEDKLLRVIVNILSNAVKFTPKGIITVRSDAKPEGFEVIIVDTGIGIRDNQLESIFDEFNQLDYPSKHKASGFGLGLSIVATIVNTINASLTVSSVPNSGTAFTFFAPRLETQAESKEKQELSR